MNHVVTPATLIQLEDGALAGCASILGCSIKGAKASLDQRACRFLAVQAVVPKIVEHFIASTILVQTEHGAESLWECAAGDPSVDGGAVKLSIAAFNEVRAWRGA